MKHRYITGISAAVLTVLLVLCFAGFAEEEVKAVNSNPASYAIEDTNPAIYVHQRNANSVVGVISNTEQWDQGTREVSVVPSSEGSGVVIADGGYIVTNYHVVSGGDVYQLLLPTDEIVDAELVGYDSSLDLAVLKVAEEYAGTLTPAAIGTVEKLSVGSTVIAIGNPGGQELSNTVTSGIVSCLAREVDGGNTSRTVKYLQHDASISSGNSGGGLFDVNGNLVGINTLKMSGGMYSSSSYEGLGFAIPVDTVAKICFEIIENGQVRRLGIGVTVQEATGAEEPTNEETPSGLYVVGLTKDGPAERAGILEGDFIIGINGNRVHTMEDLTDVIDVCNEGDVVTVRLARYTEVGADGGKDGGYNRMDAGSYTPVSSMDDYFSSPFGGMEDYFNFPFGDLEDFYRDYYEDYYRQQPAYELEIIEIDVALEYLN